jgi:S1-C subfamily serine protease
MSLDERSRRLRDRAVRALGTQRVSEAVIKVKAIIGPANIPASEPLAQAALDKMHDGHVPSPAELTALEIVIRLLRPVVLSRNGALDDLPDPAGHELYPQDLKDAWSAFRTRVTPMVPSIGRIEDRDNRHIGTGFLVSDDRIATNRHVLAALTFGSEALAPGTSRIVFKEEYALTNAKSDVVPILGVAAIHRTLDMVLLTVAKQARQPLTIDTTVVAEGMQVAVIGYPADDPVNNPMFLAGVFNGIFGKRRAALGEVLDGTASPTLYHDCSTTQGNSGSPIFAVKSGKVAGIHRAGFFMYRNEGVLADELKAFVGSL